MSGTVFRSRPLILDSNLFVLLCAGLAGPNRLESHKRLKAYGIDDFRLLRGIVAVAASVVISPNTATETSNLTRQISSPYREDIAAAFATLLGTCVEVVVPSVDAAARPEFGRLGLTDAAILALLAADKHRILLTADHDLHVAAVLNNLLAENFNHWRDRPNDFG